MTDQELQQKYPAYSKSIFADFKPDNSEVLGWQQNVKGDNIPLHRKKIEILTHFGGWITHFLLLLFILQEILKNFLLITQVT